MENESENLKDSEIINKIRNGESSLFGELVKRYQGRLFAYVYRMVNQRQEAEDILQETFLKVYKNLNSFEADKMFSAWIYRISHNETINYIKKNKKVPIASIEDNDYLINSLKADVDLSNEFQKKENDKIIQNYIEELPLKYREVLILKYSQEKSYEEIARILKKPVSTVGTLISRAKNKLKDLLENNP